MKYQIWTLDDKQKLVEAVKLNSINNRVKWAEVSKIFENHSPNQCKTYYTLVVQSQISKNCNKIWNSDQIYKLMTAVAIYGRKWKLIKRLELPEFSEEQIRQKYILQNQIRQNLFQKISSQQDITHKFTNTQIETFLMVCTKYQEQHQLSGLLDYKMVQKIMNNDMNIDTNHLIDGIKQILKEKQKNTLNQNNK
ncbi:Myb-like_DNA-binding domain-containing protein [Hexamita inflata]|uniref:Myb-like DNA-binding domain-containing protein n=1 Tax=Hexamita inflata TaxID=28002 RepID=A0AA86R2B2_9EUKA|nr:Myb-like DNA-binding domain-containing protein [Hexamita inflata]